MAYEPANNVAAGNTALLHQYTGGVSTNPLITYYKKRALDRLMKKFVFRDAFEDDMLPKQSGRTVQWFRYRNLAANTTAKTPEGGVGTGLALNTDVITATISQYTDFITLSDLLVETAIDPMVENAADLLSYRAGLSVDTITRNVVDAVGSAAELSLLGQYFTVPDARSAVHIMQGSDIVPMDRGAYSGFFMGVVHPYISYDLVQDPEAGGFIDVFKHTNTAPLQKREDRGTLPPIAGVKFTESTNVKLTAGTPNKWRTYVFGKGGFGAVDLEGRGPNKVKDPSKERFSVRIVKPQPSTADPEGVIGAFVSYNYKYAAVELADTITGGSTVHRFRYWDAPSSIVP